MRVVCGVAAACLIAAAAACAQEEGMKVSSPAFEAHQEIPQLFTCKGRDVNPPLSIQGIPAAAQSLVLVVDDPDAPAGTWLHWLVYDIPVTRQILQDSVPGTQGATSWGGMRYQGPCPPSGTHRYFFRVYALDARLRLGEGASRQAVERAMRTHILAQAELVATFRR